MALDLAGQLNECKVTENPVLVSVLYQKNKNKNQDQNIFSLLSKRNKFENKKSMFLKVPSVPKGRGWGSSIFVFFCFWTELCKQSILRASNSVNSLTNNWILWKFRTLKAEPQILSGASQIRVLERRERSEAHSLPLINRIAPNHGIALNYCFKHLGRKFSWPTIQLYIFSVHVKVKPWPRKKLSHRSQRICHQNYHWTKKSKP